MTSYSSALLKELELAAIKSGETVDALRGELARATDDGTRRVLKLRIQAAAVENQRCLAAFFGASLT